MKTLRITSVLFGAAALAFLGFVSNGYATLDAGTDGSYPSGEADIASQTMRPEANQALVETALAMGMRADAPNVFFSFAGGELFPPAPLPPPVVPPPLVPFEEDEFDESGLPLKRDGTPSEDGDKAPQKAPDPHPTRDGLPYTPPPDNQDFGA